MAIEDLAFVCSELEGDPIHSLSLNSKELFHSNFLAWLATRYPDEVGGMFEDLAGAGRPGPGATAERERASLDLVLRLPGRPLIVIENKVWALPDEYQLARYASGPLSKLDMHAVPILLSLISPRWPTGKRLVGGRTWRHLGYDAFADRLDPVARRLRATKTADDRFAGELAARYTDFVRRLCRLADHAGIIGAADAVTLDGGARAALKAARVHDGVAKLRAHQVVEAIRGRLLEAEPTAVDIEPEQARAAGFNRGAGWRFLRVGRRVIGLEAGFSNGNPLNSGQVALGNGDRLIWQFQTGQWRLAVATMQHVGRGDKPLRKLRHVYIAEHYDRWFDFGPVVAALGHERGEPAPVRGDDEYQRYDPDFAYRYCKIDQPTSVTLDELVGLAVGYLQAAIAWDV